MKAAHKLLVALKPSLGVEEVGSEERIRVAVGHQSNG